MKRALRAVLGLAGAAALMLPAGSASAGINSWYACVSRTPHAATCEKVETVHSGHSVWLRGRVLPPQGSSADVERRAPGKRHWRKIGDASIDSNGRMQFEWTTKDKDTSRNDPWRLRFHMTGGNSDVGKVFVT